MSQLRLCEACSRHVLRSEVECPFCKCALLPLPPSAAVKLAPGLSRAQRLAVAAAAMAGQAISACTAGTSEMVTPVYGAPLAGAPSTAAGAPAAGGGAGHVASGGNPGVAVPVYGAPLAGTPGLPTKSDAGAHDAGDEDAGVTPDSGVPDGGPTVHPVYGSPVPLYGAPIPQK